MENEIVRQDDLAMEAVSTASVVKQVALIQDIMRVVMKDGEHYGIIPGCGTKPSLLKPGAEKLGFTFRLRPEFEITVNDFSGGHREYQIKCTLFHILSGQEYGQGVGSCSTMEGKYRYRNADLICPECGQPTIIKGKAEFGGGWLCYKKKGGCGAKWTDEKNPFGIITAKTEHDNPADHYNTCLKISKKRAHVDAILTATAASDIFTQDIEDMGEGLDKKPITDKPPLQEPQKKQPAPATPPPPQGEEKPMTEPQRRKIWAMMHEAKLGVEECKSFFDYCLPDGARGSKAASQVIENFATLLAEWRRNQVSVLLCPQDASIPATIEACALCSERASCEVAKQLRKG